MTTAKKPVAQFWALGNRGGWGEGLTIEQAVKRAIAGGWTGKNKGKVGDGDTFFVYELDPEFPVTHISDMDGHAIHRPKDDKPTPMGRYEGERHPYKRGDDGKFLMPRKYRYQKGAISDAGRNLTRFTD